MATKHLDHQPGLNYSKMVPMHKRILLFKVHGRCNIKRLPTVIYERFEVHKRVMGHLACTYCVCFDQTGRFVFSGSDDYLIKIWCARTGRLLKTLRGHDGAVSDMSVDYENKLLATAGQDRILRIWDLRTTKLIKCIPVRSTITSVKFSPYNRYAEYRYFVTTSNDGMVRIYYYHNEKLEGFETVISYKERNRPGGQLTCSSFSSGGSFLALGASDNAIHVYQWHPCRGPYSLTHNYRAKKDGRKELVGGLIAHEDKVDSIQFCNRGYRFVSGSKDGTARIWTYKREEWKSIVLDMDTQLDQSIIHVGQQRPPTVLIVQWSRDDRYVMTSVVDHSIRVWHSRTGRLVHILREHKHDIYILESHPTDPRIFASAGHDGYLCIWNIESGQLIKKIDYSKNPRYEGPVQIFDMKFSPTGDRIVTTDSQGCITFICTGADDPYKFVPEQMFFNTDYQRLIRDVNHFVLDDNTHIVPHLMPRPMLVDMNGDPYPSEYQKLVTDYNASKSDVVPPLEEHQIKSVANLLERYSENEDKDYDYYGQMTFPDSDETECDTDTTETYSDYNYPRQKSLRKCRYQTRSRGMTHTVSAQEKRSCSRNLRPRVKRLCRIRSYLMEDE